MHIKRFFAPNMRQAMNAVRQEHGDEAVILSTKQTADGVEIVAALDPEALAYQQNVQETATLNAAQNGDSLNSAIRFEQQAMLTRERVANAYDAQQQPAARPSANRYATAQPQVAYAESVSAPSAQIELMAQELQQVRSLLENQLSSLAWGHSEVQKPEQIALLKRLMGLGFGWELSQSLLQQAQDSASLDWASILRLLEQSVTSDERDLLDRGGIIALVGPTGVGKTTTIAKLASRFVMRNSASDIALISTDSYKIGAQAQLKLFADLIQVPVYVAANQGELYSLLTAMASKKLVLIDTAGMSQKDLQLSKQLTSGHQGVNMVRNYLVMSAATQLSVMRDIVKSFGEVVLKGCILTKVDEATQLGNALTVLLESELPISYLSTGQRVPEDIEKIHARDLIDRAIVLGQQNSQNIDEQAFRLGMGKEISNAQ
ncbi:flagellar biosynthesis protein FlhF [Thiosulfatimonas sediminis]|uniref:Flagellar biosynthesis protein FlhF n=1 Tax=Thiosulfatimonas sediminis TaxID=2675054 RepID=A0A6F8PTX9_9GAMM|nr:flagellar biosynthesis protein FlhF [Thiosulfatimonas sediminis]BBP45556.1 flagellar biosynthesis protein FlhF [Thiosulfatimonas sediminis]